MKYITSKIVLAFVITVSSVQSLQAMKNFPSREKVLLACTALGIDPQTLTAELAQQNYRSLAIKYHPDKHSQSTEAKKKIAEEKFKAINNANAILKNYDFKSYNFSNTSNAHDNLRNFIRNFITRDYWNRSARHNYTPPTQKATTQAEPKTQPQEQLSPWQRLYRATHQMAGDAYTALKDDIKLTWKPALITASYVTALMMLEIYNKYNFLHNSFPRSLSYERCLWPPRPPLVDELWLITLILYYYLSLSEIPPNAPADSTPTFVRRIVLYPFLTIAASIIFGNMYANKIWGQSISNEMRRVLRPAYH